DAGLRIASLPDSSLITRRLCAMPRHTVAAPSYLKRHGRPTHPRHLAQHKCLGYAYLSTPGVWHYTNAAGEQASVRPAGPLRVNNGEALLPALIAGLGIADLPEIIVGDAVGAGCALEVRTCARSVPDAQYYHDRAVPGRLPGRSRRASGGAGVGKTFGQACYRRQPRRRRRRLDRQRRGSARRAGWLYAIDDAVVARGIARGRPAVRPSRGLR